VLNVQPYPVPVATLLAPVPGLTPTEGDSLVMAATASCAEPVTSAGA
jgi:hypothetical protein